MPVRACIGACGSGKTYALQSLVANALRARIGWAFIVLDLNSEWPGKPGASLRRAIVHDAAGARAALSPDERTNIAGLAVNPRPPHALVLVRPNASSASSGPVKWGPLVDELAEVALNNPHHPRVCLVISEAHTALKEGYPIPKHIGEIVHRFRHPSVRAGLWMDTQHWARLSKEALDECVQIYCFATGSPRSLNVLREYGGRELQDAVQRCGALAKDGQPGWHVRISPLHCTPPFQLRRL